MERDFKGIWIPREVWLSKELTLQEKVFLVEIDSLDNAEGCFANNQYFAEFFGISKTRVSIVINSLVEKGYVNSRIVYKDGTQEILKRVLNISYIGYPTKVKGGIQGKFKDNKPINNKSNNTINNNLHFLSEHGFTLDVEPFINSYLEIRNQYKSKSHKKVSDKNIKFIEDVVNNLNSNDICIERFNEAVEQYFQQLPKNNDGDIVCFLKASQKRYFDIEAGQIVEA